MGLLEKQAVLLAASPFLQIILYDSYGWKIDSDIFKQSWEESGI